MVGYVENLIRTLRRRVSRNELAIALFNLPVSKGTRNQPGLVMIQIDGLSRHQLERALQSGRMPFLRNLLARQNYETRTFYSGLPASTPAVQAELFYGVRTAVPAFSFLNRKARRVYAMFDSDCAREVEAELDAQGEGLLRGGSSWSNMYTGGAATDDSHFCASRLGLGDTFRTRRVLQALAFPILHFASLLRLISFLGAEFLVAVRDLFHGVKRGESFVMEFKTLLARAGVCIFLREILTVGVKIDVARGLPIVHANFLGYDTQSHRRGPSSAFAHWSLRGIDRAIKNIYRAAHRSARRDYQVWIYSDHGQEKTTLFRHNGKELDEIIRNSLDGFDPPTGPARKAFRFIHRRSYISRKGDRIMEGYQESIFGDPEAWFSVASMGPVGHVYLLHPRARAQKLQLAARLVHEGHVPGVLFCSEDSKHVEWLHGRQRVILPDGAANCLPHPGTLKDEVARDLVNLCRQKFAGDIVLLGWSPDGSDFTFVNEHGSHCGPGPEETQGFVILPAVTRLPAPVMEFLRPADLRAAAFHYLGRKSLPAPSPRKRTKPRQLRVMTYNVHGCRGMDGRIAPTRIARIIEQFQPDIVALQELDFGRVRSERHDQPNLIAAALGMNVRFCPTVIDQHEQYGHALLCHFPLKIIRTANFNSHARRRHVEPRGALWTRLEVDGLEVNLMNTHFGLRQRDRLAQADELLGEGWIGKISTDEPLILCGDFNMSPHGRSYRAVTQRLADVQNHTAGTRPQNTFSTFHPFTRIDHIFVSRHFTVENVFVPRNDLIRVASDHLPVVVDLTY